MGCLQSVSDSLSAAEQQLVLEAQAHIDALSNFASAQAAQFQQQLNDALTVQPRDLRTVSAIPHHIQKVAAIRGFHL